MSTSHYSGICEILKQASEANIPLVDKRARILLLIYHYLKTQKQYMSDPSSIFSAGHLEMIQNQIHAYITISTAGIIPDATRQSLGLDKAFISYPSRSLSTQLLERPRYYETHYKNPPPPLDGPDGTVDWLNVFSQMETARRKKRSVDMCNSADQVQRVDKFVETQRRLRSLLFSLRQVKPLTSNIPPCDQQRMQAVRARKVSRRRPGAGSFEAEETSRFLSELMEHRKDFFEFHKKNKDLRRKTCHLVLKNILSKEKDKDSTEERLQRERLAALKAQDEEAYLKLLAETKNDRLNLLIQQTEEYMKRLGALVLEGKGVTEEVEQGDGDDSRHALIKAKERYFKLAHTKVEPIQDQPVCFGHGRKMRGYQMRGLEWMVSLFNNKLNGILADAMGLGKTVQTLSLLAYLFENKGVQGPHLIIAPLSTLRSNWMMELNRWFPLFAENTVVYDGAKAQRKELRNRFFGVNGEAKFNILLTSDAYILKDHSVLRKVNWQYIIVDEAHRLKNPKSKLVITLNKHFVSAQRLALTGTPLQNDLQEVWALLNFLMPKIFNSADSFQNWFVSPVASAVSSSTIDVTEEEKLLIIDRLHKVLKPFVLRRNKEEVEAQLPPRSEQVVWCRLSGVQQRMYEDILNNPVEKSWPLTGQNLQMNLRKVCNHPFLFADNADIPADESLIRSCGKMFVLDNALAKLKGSGHRVLIFTQMTKVLDILEVYLNYRGYTYARLDGTTSAETRENLVKQFNAPNSDIFCFILSTRAGGLGINLQTADTVVLFDTDWNPQADEQAQSRAHRIGQTKEVVTLRLITAGTVETKMLEAAGVKLDQDQLIIQEGRFNDAASAEDDASRRQRLKDILAKSQQYGSSQEDSYTDIPTLNNFLVRSEDDRLFFDQVDSRFNSLGLSRLCQSQVLPPCLLLKTASNVEEERRLWKEEYQRMDLNWSLKLLVRQHSHRSGDFNDDLKLKRHQLNEALRTAIDKAFKKFGFDRHSAPVLYDVLKTASAGTFQSLHETERALDNILSVTATADYYWVVKLIGAINMVVRMEISKSNKDDMPVRMEDEDDDGDETDEAEMLGPEDVDTKIGLGALLD